MRSRMRLRRGWVGVRGEHEVKRTLFGEGEYEVKTRAKLVVVGCLWVFEGLALCPLRDVSD